MHTEAPARTSVAHVLVPLGATAALLPWVSSGVALVLGGLVGLTVGNPYPAATQKITRRALALSVVGLGGAMDLRTVARVGASGFGYTLVGIAACLALGTLLARVLRVPPRVGFLVSVGTAICGGSAIAAVAPTVGAKERETSVALAVVFLLNAVALFVFPALGHLCGLDSARFGRWAALAIHDTSSVVGAALGYGGDALAVATTTKLARALWIVPVALASGALARPLVRERGEGGAARAPRPWFIAGFLAVAALVTLVPALRPLGHGLSAVSRRVLVAALFLLGAGTTREAVRAAGGRALVQAIALWALVAGGTLAAIVLGVVR